MVGGGDPSTWNLGSTSPRLSEIDDFEPIFACSASAVTPSEKRQLKLIGGSLRAFQWAKDKHRTLSLSPQSGAQKRKVSKISTIRCNNSTFGQNYNAPCKRGLSAIAEHFVHSTLKKTCRSCVAYNLLGHIALSVLLMCCQLSRLYVMNKMMVWPIVTWFHEPH